MSMTSGPTLPPYTGNSSCLPSTVSVAEGFFMSLLSMPSSSNLIRNPRERFFAA